MTARVPAAPRRAEVHDYVGLRRTAVRRNRRRQLGHEVPHHPVLGGCSDQHVLEHLR